MIDPCGGDPCAAAFRAEKHMLAPRHHGGLGRMLIVGGDRGAAISSNIQPLPLVSVIKRMRHTATAAYVIDLYDRACDGSGVSAERRGIVAIADWIEGPSLRMHIGDEQPINRFAAELLADALLAWSWWRDVKWPRKQARLALDAEKRARGFVPGEDRRVIHGDSVKTLPWIAKRTKLNERTLRRRCERGEIRGWLTEEKKPRWFVDINALSADLQAEKEILQRLSQDKVGDQMGIAASALHNRVRDDDVDGRSPDAKTVSSIA